MSPAWWRRLRRLGPRGTRPSLFYRREYALSLPGTPLDALRAEKVLAAMSLTGHLGLATVREPVAASLDDLLLAHDEAYVQALSTPEVDAGVWGFTLSADQRSQAVATARAMTGGTLEAVSRARRGSGAWIASLGGGLHHARADHGQGFCLVNDVAVAIRRARGAGYEGAILVVDLDLHDGDGTRSIFAADETVFTYSVHNRHWSDPAATASLSLELGSSVTDDVFLDTLEGTLPEVFEAHRPELVLYLAGTDGAVDDPLGDWLLTRDGLFARDRMVMDLAEHHEAPVTILLAGGYGPETWRSTYRLLAYLLDGRPVTGEPDTGEVLIHRYQTLARLLTPEDLTGEPASTKGDDWGLTEEEVLTSLAGPGARTETRLLGYYTHHGLELALERAGILKRLREAGFPEPILELDLAHGEHTLRIYGAPGHRELLVEARMRRSRELVEGCELLFVEWMLLQNPRAEFSPDRPPLPGQEHPGLGLLHDAVALYVLVCERLELDGLAFVPSHYHLAAQSNRYLRFLDPAAQGRFEALRKVLAPLGLMQAFRALGEGRVRDAATGEPIAWEPSPMLLPVSEKLEELFGEEYERQVRETREALRLELVVEVGG